MFSKYSTVYIGKILTGLTVFAKYYELSVLKELLLTLYCCNLFYEFSTIAVIFMNFPLDKRFSRAVSPWEGAGHSGWTHQPWGVAVVPPGGGRPAVQHRGHLLADGDGRPPPHPPSRGRPNQTWLRLPPLLRRGAGDSRRGRKISPIFFNFGHRKT